MKKKHNAIAYLELSYILFFNDKLEFVRTQTPHSVTIFKGMLGNDFGVKLIEFNKIWPSQCKIFEQLLSLVLLLH